MLEALSAALLIAQAGACEVAIETRESAVLLRPACPTDYRRTRNAVDAVLGKATGSEIRLSFGRIERFAWLSEMLARQASSSRRWDLASGRPYEGHENAYVAAALRGMPEFTALFERWLVAGISVEKVLVKPAAGLSLPSGAPVPPESKLPFDAILWVNLKRP